MVTEESHNLTVLTFLVISTIGKVCCPVLKCCIIFICNSPFICHTPSVIIDLFGKLTCLPGIIITASCIISPDIYIYEIQISSDQFFQCIKSCLTFTCCKIIDTVQANCLIQPVPAVSETAICIAAYIIILKCFCFRIHFSCIDMNTKLGSILCTLCHQCIHIICSTDSLTDISIVRMCGIMTFICISL